MESENSRGWYAGRWCCSSLTVSSQSECLKVIVFVFYSALLVVTVLLYVLSFTAVVLFFVFYTKPDGCSINKFFIGSNMLFSIIASVISVLPKVQVRLDYCQGLSFSEGSLCWTPVCVCLFVCRSLSHGPVSSSLPSSPSTPCFWPGLPWPMSLVSLSVVVVVVVWNHMNSQVLESRTDVVTSYVMYSSTVLVIVLLSVSMKYVDGWSWLIFPLDVENHSNKRVHFMSTCKRSLWFFYRVGKKLHPHACLIDNYWRPHSGETIYVIHMPHLHVALYTDTYRAIRHCEKKKHMHIKISRLLLRTNQTKKKDDVRYRWSYRLHHARFLLSRETMTG